MSLFIVPLPLTTIIASLAEADDYVRNTAKKAIFRVMLASRVMIGRPYEQYLNNPSLLTPPPGYNSVSLFHISVFPANVRCRLWEHLGSISTMRKPSFTTMMLFDLRF
jgi:hypothetical protein